MESTYSTAMKARNAPWFNRTGGTERAVPVLTSRSCEMTADSGKVGVIPPVLIHDSCLNEATKDHLGYERGKLAPVDAKVRDPGGTSRRFPKWLPYLLFLGQPARLWYRLRSGAQTPGNPGQGLTTTRPALSTWKARTRG